jgi:hypothetical protein
MQLLLFITTLILANGLIFPSYSRFIYNRNRSLPLPDVNELETNPCSENIDIKWEDGEVPWDIEDLKNITLQPMKIRSTSVSSFCDYCLFHTLID